MFYESIKAAWAAGKVRVGLPAASHGDQVTIEGKGFNALKAACLSAEERGLLADLAKTDALLILSLPESVEAWTTEQRDAVRRLVKTVGLQEEGSPQRALLVLEGRQLFRSQFPGDRFATAREKPSYK